MGLFVKRAATNKHLIKQNLNRVRKLCELRVEEVRACERVHDGEASFPGQEWLDVFVIEFVKLGGKTGESSAAPMFLDVLHVVEEVQL